MDFDESVERIQFFIGKERNLGSLDPKNFDIFLKQINDFYFEKTKSESLLDWNHILEIKSDLDLEVKSSIIDVNLVHSEEDMQPESEHFKYEDEDLQVIEYTFNDDDINLNDSNFED